MARTTADVVKGDEVLVFDRNGSKVGQPEGGWTGKVVSKGPKWITVQHPGTWHNGGTEKFGYNGRQASGFRRFELPEVYEARQRMLKVRQALRDHGVFVEEFHSKTPSVEQLEAMLAVLYSIRPEYIEDLSGLQAKILDVIAEHVKSLRPEPQA